MLLSETWTPETKGFQLQLLAACLHGYQQYHGIKEHRTFNKMAVAFT